MRDENYMDPQPVEYCLVCRDPIFHGDDCYETSDGTFHEDCVGEYINEFFSTEEMIQALRLEKKIWCAL